MRRCPEFPVRSFPEFSSSPEFSRGLLCRIFRSFSPGVSSCKVFQGFPEVSCVEFSGGFLSGVVWSFSSGVFWSSLHKVLLSGVVRSCLELSGVFWGYIIQSFSRVLSSRILFFCVRYEIWITNLMKIPRAGVQVINKMPQVHRH